MTVDALIAWARSVFAEPWRGTDDLDAAHAIVSLLSASSTCGYTIAAGVDEQGPHVTLMDSRMTPDEAQSVAVGLLRARDEAKEIARG